MTATYVVADVRDALAAIPDGTVDLVLTSPPFLALRSYLPPDHPDKGREIGSEPTPAAFLDTLLGLSAEWRRTLAPHGTLAVELGDTYSGSGGAGGDYADGGMRDGQQAFTGSARTEAGSRFGADPRRKGTSSSGTGGTGWPLAKSLSLVPEAYRLALAYGHNPLTGTPSPAGRWRVRNNVTWARPNPPVGALCVDAQTEALTPDGWKRHDALEDGDLIAVYDRATDSCRFAPAKFVRWDRVDEPMVTIEKRKTSQRLTEDHRCLVRTRKRPEPHIVLAGDLTASHQTMLAAPFDDVGGVEPMSDVRAELLGWYITEGSRKGRQARIHQSKTANPAKVDRIRSLLIDEGADFAEYEYRRTTGTYGGHILTTFTVKGELAEWLNLHHKRLPEHYAATWPTTTLRALWRGLVDGDGHRRRDGGVLFFQKDRQVVDAFQIVAIRLGLRCSVTRQEAMDGWQATVGNPEHFESSRWTNVRKWDGEVVPRETYTGTVWCPMVETSFWLARRNGRTFVTGNSDKFRPSTSDLVVACVAADRWFDLDAVRTPAVTGDRVMRQTTPTFDPTRSAGQATHGERLQANNPAGAPPLDHWIIPPGGYRGSHYATWPPELCRIPIEAMCPRRVCRTCGAPSRREVGPATYASTVGGRVVNHYDGERRADGANAWEVDGGNPGHVVRSAETTGWSSCGCPGTDGLRLDGWHRGTGWRPGVVLDPFGGSGTTGVVATGLSRDAILIDLDDRNLDLARERLGMFLVEGTLEELAARDGAAA